MSKGHSPHTGQGGHAESVNGGAHRRVPSLQLDGGSEANACPSESEVQTPAVELTESRAGQRLKPAPDGGWGWVVLTATVLVLALTLAFPSCIGIFYTELQNDFQASNSETSWVPSIMTAVLHVGGPLCSVLVEHYGCRVTVMVGGLLSGVGMATSSFTQSIGQLYITAGVITGLGFCLSFQPAVTILGHYFVRRRALANAISSTGTAIGLSIWPLFSQFLLSCMGWRGSFLILGGVLLNCCVCGAVMRPLNPRRRHREIKEASPKEGGWRQVVMKKLLGFLAGLQKHMAFDLFCTSRRYRAFTISITWMMLGFIVPLIYVVPYATSHGMEQSKAALLLAILGFINIFTRPLSGVVFGMKYFSGKTVYLFSTAVFVNGLSNCICCISASFPVLVLYCVVYGLSMSVVGSLMFTVMMEIVDMSLFPSALGLLTIMESVTLLIGPPLAGLLVDTTQTYSYVFYASSAAVSSAAVFLWISFYLVDKEERTKATEKSPSHLSPDCKYIGMEQQRAAGERSAETVFVSNV
ncbi:monocarboxylate transporter 6 [Amia ocellicauda]|uniref:monocarboxylate transporter 6 n=1 Tax=Amia ocellicauda TaxID=2972642 RepID=UPI0034642923